MKPRVIFFGEMIPPDALMESQMLANSADAILVVGTSAVVYPASSIPYMAKQNRAKVIEMNLEHTGLTGIHHRCVHPGEGGRDVAEASGVGGGVNCHRGTETQRGEGTEKIL